LAVCERPLLSQALKLRVHKPERSKWSSVSAARDIRYLDAEREWLLQSQMANGAIAQNPLQNLVVPYFASIAAKTMVDIDASRAKNYISWYLANMNMPDRDGLSGTIYDFVMKDGELVPTYKYDSADSYAANFLSLVAYYYHRTGDIDFVTSNLTAIDLAAQVILALQDDDGLVRVMPGSRTKYLMDNSECYRGLLDWAVCSETWVKSTSPGYMLMWPARLQTVSGARFTIRNAESMPGL
jgi:hypothetical protein